MSISQFFAILRARWKICLSIFFGVIVLVVGVSLVLPKKYTAVASVVLDVKPDPLAAVLYNGMNPGLIQTQIDIIQSDRVAFRVVRNLKLNENPQIRAQWQEQTDGEGTIEQWLSDTFQKALDVKPGRESNVINVSYQAQDPRFAAGLANAFVQAYMQTALELKVDPAKQYSNFFDQRAKEARDVLEVAQKKVSAFQTEKGIIATDERLDVENTRLNELSSQLVAVQALASESGSRQAAAGSSGDQMQEVLNSALIGTLKSDLARGEARLKELSARYGDSYPQVVETKANVEETRRRVEAETKRVTSGVGVSNSINQQRVSELRASIEAQRQKIQQMKALRDEGAVLVRDAENAQHAYDLISQRLNQASLESQATQSNVSVLTAAVPPVQPSSPRVLLNTMLAVFVGVLLATAVMLVLELSDRRTRSAADVVQAIGLPVLGTIPRPNAKRMFRGPRNSLMQQRLLGQLPAPNERT
ncbi:chain length determinant protein EpsF [Paucibacter sp. R3-3]|uniref:Chain length determinant protein EpsF n=1 Tax=Roseateles agri TaxID=3098619 RepID=A0ABU5DC55_9BURK|nr:chain length determinant protein EpsF [Paucibacter sp. R3-3]MDY0743863.1 chain length determinant protein EpsF [Paucibacter sp. R3-3]